MAHQQPRAATQASYSYALDHRTALLIQALAKEEAEKLKMQRLSPPQYIDRLIALEAERNLSSEKIKEIEREAQERTERRLETMRENEAKKPKV